jgi:ABC-type multidrug transport system ATPase subunit
VTEGSRFDFFGANGAAKTTLTKMITSIFPSSDGIIEIFARDLQEYNDPTLFSIYPLFNTHLFRELTPPENFVVYSMLF